MALRGRRAAKCCVVCLLCLLSTFILFLGADHLQNALVLP